MTPGCGEHCTRRADLSTREHAVDGRSGLTHAGWTGAGFVRRMTLSSLSCAWRGAAGSAIQERRGRCASWRSSVREGAAPAVRQNLRRADLRERLRLELCFDRQHARLERGEIIETFG